MKVHEVFLTYAAGTQRFRAIAAGDALMVDMQLDVYRMGSRSHAVVASKAAYARSFFLDLKVCRWNLEELDAFRVAAWVRGRVSGGLKNAARVAKQTLLLVAAATGVELYIKDPLVNGQIAEGMTTSSCSEPPVKAIDIGPDMISKFEELVSTGTTVQLRCLAGFMALLGGSSLRASDAIRTRGLRIAGQAISGVSRMKGKKAWTRWYANKDGVSGKPWAEAWLAELQREGLPGCDFILWAPNTALDGWIKRPATYADVRRSLHLILMLEFSMEAKVAVTYNPHGFRHTLVGAAQQLRRFGLFQEEDVERLGHWSRGSAMPRRYDTEAGVTELDVRTTILQQLRNGWRPSTDGNLPQPPIARDQEPTRRSSDDDIRVVSHLKRKRVHRWRQGSVSVCGWWSCGSPSQPSKDSSFDEQPEGWKKCAKCWSAALGTA